MTTLTWSDLPEQLRMSDEVLQMRAAMRAGKSIRIIAHPTAATTVLARLLHQFIPIKERIDTDRDMDFIYRLAGMRLPGPLTLPFRAPHHTVSISGMVGCSRSWRPGELSLAHGGTLLLDDVAEFDPGVLRHIATVYDDKRVTWFGAGVTNRLRLPDNTGPSKVGIPAAFRLIGTQKPCPCGWHGYSDNNHTCTCSDMWVQRYMDRASQADLEFDLTVRLPISWRSPVTS